MTKLTRPMLLDAAAKWYGHCASSPNYTKEARQAALEAQRQVLNELSLGQDLAPPSNRDSWGGIDA